MVEIIGLGVTAQVGKDTAADHLESILPGAKRVAFADKLKRAAMLIFGLSYDQCYGTQEQKETVDPRYDLTPREIMQGIGDKMRGVYPDIWIDTVFYNTIPELQEQGFDKFIISDVRYPNEADKIKRSGGVVVRIDRPGSGVGVGANHLSETAMKDYEGYHKVIDNNGTLDEFFVNVESLAEELGWQSKEETVQTRTEEV